jgi:hypothetical protein
MKKFFKDLFTGRNNNYDIARVMWFQSIQAYMLISAYSIYQGGTFDAIGWGAGLAALLGGGGAAIGLKANADPDDLNGDGYVDEIERARALERRMKHIGRPRRNRGRNMDDDDNPFIGD